MLTNIEMAVHLSQVYSPLMGDTLHALANIITCHKYKKGEIVLSFGEICKSILIVEKGLLRQFYFKRKKDLTEHISYEDGVIICIKSYFENEPSLLSIEALELSVVWEVPKDKIEVLAMENAEIGRIYRKFLEYSLIESQIKADMLRFESASNRYKKLMLHHPEIIKRAPLIYIASLLQMTPETLSRVRAQDVK